LLFPFEILLPCLAVVGAQIVAGMVGIVERMKKDAAIMTTFGLNFKASAGMVVTEGMLIGFLGASLGALAYISLAYFLCWRISLKALVVGLFFPTLLCAACSFPAARKAMLTVTPSLRRKWYPDLTKSLKKELKRKRFIAVEVPVRVNEKEFKELVKYLRWRFKPTLVPGPMGDSLLPVYVRHFYREENGRKIFGFVNLYYMYYERGVAVQVNLVFEGEDRELKIISVALDSYGMRDVAGSLYKSADLVRKAVLEWHVKVRPARMRIERSPRTKRGQSSIEWSRKSRSVTGE